MARLQNQLSLLGTAGLVALAMPARPVAAQTEVTATPCGVTAPAEQPKKKKGFGLGGLMSAAKNAGVGRMLGGGMLGSSVKSQVAGAVAGRAIEAASGDSSNVAVPAQMALGSHRAAQVAGAVAGTAVNAAAASAQQAAAASAQQEAATPTDCPVTPTVP